MERLLGWGQTDGLRDQQSPKGNRGRVRVQETDRKGDRDRMAEDAQKARKMVRERGRERERKREKQRERTQKEIKIRRQRRGASWRMWTHTRGESG